MKFITSLVIQLLIILTVYSQDVNTNILLQSNEINLTQLIKSDISTDSLINTIQSQDYKSVAEEKRGLFYLKNKCTDGVEREFSVYIPKGYNENIKTPLFVYLHGGVGTKELTPDSIWFEYLNSLPWMEMAEKQNYICLFPKAEYKAMWWDTVGAENILSQVRILKQSYNIDDNRVYLNGFSDGASGNYFMAMCHPTDFACFNAYNGFPAVGGFTKSSPTYFVNLQNTVMHVINTDIDGLYPDKKIQPMVKLAQSAGGNIFYRVYTGVGHRMTYLKEELPKAIKFLEENPRNKFPTKIVLETVNPKQGRYNWLQINATDTLQKNKEWHSAYNMQTVDDRLSFGFMNDKEFNGKGIRIARVAGGVCSDVGLQTGDIFTKIDTFNIFSMKDMNSYKKQASRGDSVRFEILRNDTLKIFKTKFPDPVYSDLFNYQKKSGQVKGSYIANTFYIEASRIKSFSIFIHPDMVQLNQNVKVFLNGNEIFNELIKPDNTFVISNYIENRDKELLYVKRLDF